MSDPKSRKIILLHAAGIFILFALQFIVPEYHHLALTRIMVLAIFAMGYNLLFGYTGLLSLGHAMFFAAGLYGAGLTAYYFGWNSAFAFLAGVGIGFFFSLLVGLIALRTTGVAFMIVTMMFSQVAYLATLYFTSITRGDEGLVLPETTRIFSLAGLPVDLTNPVQRYNIALALLSVTIVIVLAIVRGPMGRVLTAIRQNEPRTLMLGYDTYRTKLVALTLSGTITASAGAAYALLFAYIGSSFASTQYSIEALLFTLLGGAGTVLGPLIGTMAMFYMIDTASVYTSAYFLFIGIALILLVLYFPKGILGSIRERWVAWLP